MTRPNIPNKPPPFKVGDPINKPTKRGKKPRGGKGGKPKGEGQTGSSKYSYLETLSPKEIGRETRAITNTKFRPVERAKGAEIRASKQRSRQVGDWWQSYLDEVSGATADVDAAYAQAAATGQQFIDQAGARDTANTAALQAEAAKSAEQRGAAPGTELAAREAQAASNRGYLSAAEGASTARQGATQHAYMRDKRRIGAGQRIASGKEEHRRTRGLEKERTSLRRDRGESAAQTRGELTQRERDYLIKRQAFGLEKKEGSAERRQQERENAQEESRLTKSQRETERHNRATEQASREDNKPSSGRTPDEKEAAREGYKNGVATLKRMVEAYGPPKSAASWEELESKVEGTEGVSSVQARKIVARYRKRIEKGRKEGNRGVPGTTKTPYAP